MAATAAGRGEAKRNEVQTDAKVDVRPFQTDEKTFSVASVTKCVG